MTPPCEPSTADSTAKNRTTNGNNSSSVTVKEREEEENRRRQERTTGSSSSSIVKTSGRSASGRAFLKRRESSWVAKTKTKASVWKLKSWVGLLLTLDGRDKFTMLIQYVCRMMVWYYGNKAKQILNNNAEQSTLSLSSAKIFAARFQALQSKLAESRKAFRLGRSLVEVEKLQRLGLSKILSSYFQNRMTATTKASAQAPTPYNNNNNSMAMNGAGYASSSATGNQNAELVMPHRRSKPGKSSLRSSSMYTSPLSTLKEGEEGPSNTATSRVKGSATDPRVDTTSSNSSQQQQMPLWKALGKTVNFMGLFCFWAIDNMAYLTASGFLDDFGTMATKTNNNSGETSMTMTTEKERLANRKISKARFTRNAYRCSFVAGIAGLVVNAHNFNKTLQEERHLAAEERAYLKASQQANYDYDYDSVNEDGDENRNSKITTAEETLADILPLLWNHRMFPLLMALLKSCCDVTMYSNNPGVNLHERYRGRKVNEGIISVCGMISACAVMYKEFPQSTTMS